MYVEALENFLQFIFSVEIQVLSASQLLLPAPF